MSSSYYRNNFMQTATWKSAFTMLCSALFFVFFTLIPTVSNAHDAIHLRGSTTMVPVIRKLVVAYRLHHPNQVFSITSSSSGDGINGLTQGTTDIGLLSRETTPLEERRSRRLGIELRKTTIAADALIPIVHPSNPITDITTEQLVAIYTGEIKNWQELGGPNMRIIPCTRLHSSGSHDIWMQMVMKEVEEDPETIRFSSNLAIVESISKTPGGIGYVGLGFVGPEIKQLILDGTKGTRATVRDGTYSVTRPLNFYTGRNVEQNVTKFITFVLGQEGQEIIGEEGFDPINARSN